tara:strand:- start:709 stop:1086 length:378 start_codon:yes stop_codon:yes gene_type:complete
MKKLLAWGNRNAKSIYTGCFVALIMTAIMIIQDMKHISKEVDHFSKEIKLIEENNELSRDSIDQFGMIQDLLKTQNSQNEHLEQATTIINEQVVLIQRLIEYLKSINHWPPKIDPPKPIDPDKWI